jgi:hypothetical protein
MLHFSWQWVSGFMTVALLTLVILMLFLPVFKVHQIQVDGIQRVALADVQNTIVKATSSIFTLDPQKIINAVGLAFPELTDIKLKVDMSGALKLTVTERKPVLAWVNGDQILWVDADGVVMTPRGDGGTLMTIQSTNSAPLTKPVQKISSAIDYANMLLARKDTPVTPQDLINNIDPTVLKAALELNTLMPSGASLVYDSVSGMGWQDPRGWKVYFGLDLENIQFKEVEYQAIVDRLTALGIKPKVISVEFVDSPFIRTK